SDLMGPDDGIGHRSEDRLGARCVHFQGVEVAGVHSDVVGAEVQGSAPLFDARDLEEADEAALARTPGERLEGSTVQAAYDEQDDGCAGGASEIDLDLVDHELLGQERQIRRKVRATEVLEAAREELPVTQNTHGAGAIFLVTLDALFEAQRIRERPRRGRAPLELADQPKG